MNDKFYKKISFKALKEELKLEARTVGEWETQPNGVKVKPLISEEESNARNLTYIGLIFPVHTDAHYYKTQVDSILFQNRCGIAFYEKVKGDYLMNFSSFNHGDAISIPSYVIRKIIPDEKKPSEIELIVQPKFNPADEVHVFD